jgi:hypothetical protein
MRRSRAASYSVPFKVKVLTGSDNCLTSQKRIETLGWQALVLPLSRICRRYKPYPPFWASLVCNHGPTHTKVVVLWHEAARKRLRPFHEAQQSRQPQLILAVLARTQFSTAACAMSIHPGRPRDATMSQTINEKRKPETRTPVGPRLGFGP